MTFRTRILLACLAVAVAPLILFALGARRAVHDRLTAQFEARVSAASDVIRDDLTQQARAIGMRLQALAARIDEDAQQRAALLQRRERAALLDYASSVLPATGLDFLLLLDSAGTVLSSGHFRNDYDRVMPALPGVLAAQEPVLLAARRPQGRFLALVRAHAFRVGGQRFALAGGIEVDSSFVRRLARGAAHSMVVALEYDGDTLSSSNGRTAVREASTLPEQIVIPFADDVAGAWELRQARWTITHSSAPLHAIRRGMDAWFLAAVVAAIVLALVMARVLAARVNRPLEELAARTSRVNLDRLDVEFALERQDEIGSLSRLLDAMVLRLRRSANQLRVAERRATVGDMARQVNHDIRNGLLPIRNVIRHLTEVAQGEPEQLGTVFEERASTLQSGISYLENLASNYARMSPRTEQRVCDVNAIIHTLLRDFDPANAARVRLGLSEATPRIAADPVALRRIIENLTINALESLEDGTGQVSIKTSIEGTGSERRISITVADTGSGIEEAALEHIFEDFYSTKQRGTGLGLSIVRRLVADMGGRIRVQSERGKGTSFRVEVPEAR
jgi:signal transduction histidine kinase